jgi:hypothetical protein
MSKCVTFDLKKNILYKTYSAEEYDRRQIDSILYKKAYQKVSPVEWLDMINTLNAFKCEMVVHKNSVGNTKLY